MLAGGCCCRLTHKPLLCKVLSADIESVTTPALGSGILLAYPQIATIAGVQGLVVYALSSSLPLLIFAFLGPVIRKKCPEGFVLTQWTQQRYGSITALFLGLLT